MARICFVLIALLLLSGQAAQSQSASVSLNPSVVIAGAPELIMVHVPAGSQVSGQWLGRSIQFFEGERAGDYYALAGVDVDAPLGPSALSVHIVHNSTASDLTRSIEIHPGHYRTGALTVAPRFIEPSPEAKKQIEEEVQLKKKVFGASDSEPLWRGSFRAPVPAQATDSFGTRRMFNGKVASIHKGADFRAQTGTPVRASNSGTVVLARPLYFEGNCVVIDHGQGLYTLSMHFSRIDVKEGQHVKAGDVLGLSGATGRVTGPHLHWAVRWHDAYLDPVKLLHMNLNGIH